MSEYASCLRPTLVFPEIGVRTGVVYFGQSVDKSSKSSFSLSLLVSFIMSALMFMNYECHFIVQEYTTVFFSLLSFIIMKLI